MNLVEDEPAMVTEEWINEEDMKSAFSTLLLVPAVRAAEHLLRNGPIKIQSQGEKAIAKPDFIVKMNSYLVTNGEMKTPSVLTASDIDEILSNAAPGGLWRDDHFPWPESTDSGNNAFKEVFQVWLQLITLQHTAEVQVLGNNQPYVISPRFAFLSSYDATLFFQRGDGPSHFTDGNLLVSGPKSPSQCLLSLIAIIWKQSHDNEHFKPMSNPVLLTEGDEIDEDIRFDEYEDHLNALREMADPDYVDDSETVQGGSQEYRSVKDTRGSMVRPDFELSSSLRHDMVIDEGNHGDAISYLKSSTNDSLGYHTFLSDRPIKAKRLNLRVSPKLQPPFLNDLSPHSSPETDDISSTGSNSPPRLKLYKELSCGATGRVFLARLKDHPHPLVLKLISLKDKAAVKAGKAELAFYEGPLLDLQGVAVPFVYGGFVDEEQSQLAILMDYVGRRVGARWSDVDPDIRYTAHEHLSLI